MIPRELWRVKGTTVRPSLWQRDGPIVPLCQSLAAGYQNQLEHVTPGLSSSHLAKSSTWGKGCCELLAVNTPHS